MADLTTRTKCKRALGIPDGVTTHDDFIDTLLEVADQQILAYTGMAALTQTTVSSEGYDIMMEATDEITLRNFPVSSVASVVSSGSTLSTDSYYVENNSGAIRLVSQGSFFPQGKQTVKVTYTYGFATVPADLSHAATIVVCGHFNRNRHAGMRSEMMNQYMYRLENSALPSGAVALLARYRRVFPKGSQP